MPAKKVGYFFNVGEKRLRQWEREGLVRTAKLNHSQSGSKLYYGPDLDDILLRISAGLSPKSKLGKIK